VKIEASSKSFPEPIPLTISLSVHSAKDECLNHYKAGATFICHYPLGDEVVLAAARTETNPEFQRARKLYISQMREGYIFLSVGALGLAMCLLLGFWRYMFLPLHQIFPFLRKLRARSLFSKLIRLCCSRDETSMETEEQKKEQHIGVYRGADTQGNVQSLGLDIPSDVKRLRQNKVYRDKMTGTKFKLEGITNVPVAMVTVPVQAQTPVQSQLPTSPQSHASFSGPGQSNANNINSEQQIVTSFAIAPSSFRNSNIVIPFALPVSLPQTPSHSNFTSQNIGSHSTPNDTYSNSNHQLHGFTTSQGSSLSHPSSFQNPSSLQNSSTSLGKFNDSAHGLENQNGIMANVSRGRQLSSRTLAVEQKLSGSNLTSISSRNPSANI